MQKKTQRTMAAVIADSALQFFPFLEKCENFRLNVKAMGCIQREDGKLEMPIDNAPSLDLTTISLDDYLKQMHAVKEEVSEKHVDPMLALASEFAKAEDWTIEEVATEPYRPVVI